MSGGGLGSGAEGVDEVGDEIFLHGTSFDGFFFVLYDDFVVGDFDDFSPWDDELGVEEAFDEGALDDELFNGEIIVRDGEVDDFAELAALFSFDFEV